jgi:hypothetical protein
MEKSDKRRWISSLTVLRQLDGDSAVSDENVVLGSQESRDKSQDCWIVVNYKNGASGVLDFGRLWHWANSPFSAGEWRV